MSVTPTPSFAEFRAADIEVDDGITIHTLIAGDGPGLLLVPGWPQTSYSWRLVAPALAEDHTVVVADPRGVGGSALAVAGYDTGTLAHDLVTLMSALGHERFDVAGHDVGMWIAYALAADHRERVGRLAVAEAVLPGVTPSPMLLGSHEAASRLWHFAFNRLDDLNELLIRGREQLFVEHQVATKAARPLPADAVDHYVAALARSPEALHASFGPYRALDETIAQNASRATEPLQIPVLAIGGERSLGDSVATTMRLAADDVRGESLPGTGHYPAEEDPQTLLAHLTDFFVPGAPS